MPTAAAADHRSTIQPLVSLAPGLRPVVAAAVTMVAAAIFASGCSSDTGVSTVDVESDPPATIGSKAESNSETQPDPLTDDGAEQPTDSGAEDPQQTEVHVRVPDPAMVPVLAAELNASTVLATFGDEQVLWHDGSFVDLDDTMSEFNLWSDGRFVYGLPADSGETPVLSIAMNLDGEIVCTAVGRPHHATRRTDGSYVMAVEESEPKDNSVPLFAVDCDSDKRQPIEPVVVFTGDGGTRVTERIAGRIFTGFGDAEGNADFFNEDGRSLNGDDYAGYHTFTDDASIVVYGDMGVGSGPHFSPVIRARDTTDGLELWTAEFEQPFQHIFHVGDHTAVLFHADFDALFDQNPVSDRAVLFDTVTGDRLVEIDVGFQVDFIG